MRVSEIARIWGVSVSYVARLAKKGMPLDSVAEADAWRLANLKKPPRSDAGSALVKVALASGDKDPGLYDHDTASRLKRAQEAEVLAFQLLKQLAEGENAVAMRAGVHAWGEAKKRVAEAELEHAKHLQVTGKLVDKDEEWEKAKRIFTILRQLLDALPSSVCARANPSDPECAKQALEDGVDQILRAICKSEQEGLAEQVPASASPS